MPADPSSGDTSAGSNDREIDDAWICEHYERVHRAAWLMTGNWWEAEDLAQETFVAAIDQWDRFEGRSSESTWLYAILIRLNQRRGRSVARMRRRLSQYIERHLPYRERSVHNDDPQIRLAQRQWRDSVWATVARLPPQQRDAVVLRFGEGMSYDEIAQTLACAVGTAKSRVHHGIKKLEAMMRQGGSAPTEKTELAREISESENDSDLQPAIPIQ